MDTLTADTTTVDRLVPGEQYAHLGIDTTGAHHHYLGDENAIVVAPDRYERIESGIRVYYRVRSDDVEHVEVDITPQTAERRWCSFVAQTRGWRTRTNQIYDVGATVWEAVGR